MFLELLKQFIGEYFLLVISALGFLLILSHDHANLIGRKTIRTIRALVILAFILACSDFIEAYFADLEYPTLWRKIFSWLSYTLRPLIVAMLMRILVFGNKKTLFLYLPIVLTGLIYATTFIEQTRKIAFDYGVHNNFIRGPLSYTSPVVCVLYMLALIVMVIKKFEEEGLTREIRAVVWCAIACLGAGFYEMFVGSAGILNSAILVSCLFYYLLFFSQATQEDKEEKELLLSDQRAAMVVQEIQPRFILEILNRVQDQMKSSPCVASQTLDNLVDYLEKNLEATDFVHPVPFEEEMNRVKTYVRIIQTGFPGLRVELQLEDKDFQLPALTVMHMVENSINHAFEGRNTGTITIKSFGSESGHTVIIQDDGIGFSNREEYTSENQGSRFGIENVTDRLQRMCNGDLNIVSKPGAGTTVMISIPNEDVKMPEKKQRRRLVIPGREKM